jgi:DNA-directed RNA polymerase subunit RPC12/RpoP
MEAFIAKISSDFPHLTFTPGTAYYWCPATSEIFYKANAAAVRRTDKWSLLHELSHALLGHTSYQTDLELLHLEVAAWDKATELARAYRLRINAEYIQDCIDTYRDWLYKRSLCPTCGTQNLQHDNGAQYRCFNCHARWHVSSSRFNRAYRQSKGHITSDQNPGSLVIFQ